MVAESGVSAGSVGSGDGMLTPRARMSDSSVPPDSDATSAEDAVVGLLVWACVGAAVDVAGASGDGSGGSAVLGESIDACHGDAWDVRGVGRRFGCGPCSFTIAITSSCRC